jgi:hypothetical protein
MNDPAIQILDLENTALEQLHESLHKSQDSATIELHHLVTTEMLKRGLNHGHLDDFWTNTIIETSYIQDADLESLGSGYSVDFVKAIKESTGSDIADVRIVLTVDGYEMRIEPVDKRQLSARVETALERKVAEHNEKMDSDSKKTSIGDLREVFRRGVGAYRTNPSSVRPNVSNPDQWAMARVNAFLYALRNGKFRSGKFDTDLLPENHPMSSKRDVEKMIRQENGKFTVYNEEGTRKFGTYETQEEAERRLEQIERFSKSKTYTPPQGVREAARRALDWIEDGKAGSGFTPVGRRRAQQLAAGQNVSRDTVLRMKSFLARHAVDRKAEGFNRGEKGYPSPGRVAWDAWGGDEARTWVNGILTNVEKSYDPMEGLNERQNEMYRDYENQVAVHGMFNQSADANGAHYFGRESNPFAAEGMNCANCVFYLGGGGCEIVEGKIDPMGLCKLWIIPQDLIERETEPFPDTEFVEKHGSHDQASHGSWAGGAGLLGGVPAKAADIPANSSRSPEAVKAATTLRNRIEEVEPEITADMADLADRTGGTFAEIQGRNSLEQRVKSTDSLARKIEADAAKDFNGDTEKAAEKISDASRYTMVFDDDNYTDKTEEVLQGLTDKGYEVKEVKNFWQSGDPYDGMNVKVEKNGIKTELQLHTKNSLNIKETKLHPKYESYRASTNNRQRRALWNSMVNTAGEIPRPRNYQRLLAVGLVVVQNYETAQQAGLLKTADFIKQWYIKEGRAVCVISLV